MLDEPSPSRDWDPSHVMRSLVLGSSGRVGRALCAHLRGQGDVVGEFDIRRDESEDVRSATIPLESYDRVFLLAWDVGGARYLNDPGTQRWQFEWNTAILESALPQIADAGIPLTFASSQLARDSSSAYAVTKRLGEQWTERMGGVSVRLWNAYGSVEPISERSQAVSDFVVQAVSSGAVHVLTRGEERRRFVHLDDISEGLRIAADSAGHGGGVLDLASAAVHSIRQVATRVADMAGAEVRFGTAPATEAPLTGYTNVPGWTEKWSLREGIDDLLARVRSEGVAAE